MDDDVLLNFAPAGASTSRQVPRKGGAQRGRTQKETQQKSRPPYNGATSSPSTDTRRYLPKESATEEAGPSQAHQSSSISQARKEPRRPQQAPSNVRRDREAHAPKAATAATAGTSATRPSSSSIKGRAGVISSLFARDEALEDKWKGKGKDSAPTLRAAATNAPGIDSAFPALGLDPLLSAHLASDKIGIKRPTSIQRNALPFLLHDARDSTHFQQDALIHAQTGSGKTMCYLLPIIQSLLPLCETSWIDRSCLGTLAIILAPTRELANQIYENVVTLANLSLSAAERSQGGVGQESDDEEEKSIRRTRWIVPGLLSGGATKNHEKSRIRKGLPILVATPGRLLDHLRNTAALDVGRLQWLVLDEADRLLEMGFEQTLNDIMKAIDGRRRAACEVQRLRMRDELGNQVTEEALHESNVIDTFGEAWWRQPRRTILCSATLDEGVQVLAGKSLNEARIIRDDGPTAQSTEGDEKQPEANAKTTLSAPGQLVQNVVIVPPKQRLVTLVALLRRAITTHQKPKIMVFLSCTDSVDFHLQVLAGVNMAKGAGIAGQEAEGCVAVDMSQRKHASQLLPAAAVFRLHGSLSQQERNASLREFIKSTEASILFCTSVASRGLDLDVTHVIQLDAPTEKGVDEYLHRIGRTARAGQDGESWLVLMPNEEACIAHYEAASSAGGSDRGVSKSSGHDHVLQRHDVTSILLDGFGGSKADTHQVQTRATDAQMAFERWALARESNAQLARRAYLSHLRAYATHPPSERHIFSIAQLQLGHLAKAFALREAPGDIRAKAQASAVREKKRLQNGDAAAARTTDAAKRKRDAAEATPSNHDELNRSDEDSDAEDSNRYRNASLQFERNADTEARMYAKVREMGKQHKRRGVLGAHGGASEFQIVYLNSSSGSGGKKMRD